MAPAVSPGHWRARGRGSERTPWRAQPENNMNRTIPLISWRHRITALIVDSVSFFRTFHRCLMISYGVQTEAVATRNAAALLIFGGRAFDLIVIDTSLQEAIVATMQLRIMAPRSMIVAITTLYSDAEKASFLESGADEYLEKPFTPEMFIPILVGLDNEQ